MTRAQGAAMAAGVAVLADARRRRNRLRAAIRATRMDNERLAAEQAALRRVAAAEAAGAAASGVYTLVAGEVARLLDAPGAVVIRHVPGGPESIVGRHGWPPPPAAPVSCAAITEGAGTWGELRVASADEQRLQDVAAMMTTPLISVEGRALTSTLLGIDALTGLATHGAYRERLEAEVSRARRHGRPVSVVLVDVDRFAEINRRRGVQGGDRVLAELAEVLRHAARSEDLVARLGRDEYAVLLPEVDRHGAYQVVERIRGMAAGSAFLHRERLTLTAGVCDLEIAGDTEALHRLAESALYWGKAQGRDVTWIYDPDVVGELDARERTERLDRFDALAGLRALARAVDAKDPYTKEHSERVAALARLLARQLGWSGRRTEQLAEAALLHDVGKIGVPDAILLKPGRLTPGERETIETHAALGAEIVGDVLGPEQVRWIACHHERPDGRGYPRALRGEEVPDGAAILGLADAWDVMTSDRPYSAPLSVERAFEECCALAGDQFRPDVVDALAQLREHGRLDDAQPVCSARR